MKNSANDEPSPEFNEMYEKAFGVKPIGSTKPAESIPYSLYTPLRPQSQKNRDFSDLIVAMRLHLGHITSSNSMPSAAFLLLKAILRSLLYA